MLVPDKAIVYSLRKKLIYYYLTYAPPFGKS